MTAGDKDVLSVRLPSITLLSISVYSGVKVATLS